MNLIAAFIVFLRGMLVCRCNLAAENLALRQQLAVLHRSVPHPKIRRRGRVFWVCWSRLWDGWRSALVLVRPETVVR